MIQAFYDILKGLAIKYDFSYPEEKLVPLSKKVKQVVDDKAKYTDWSKRDDINVNQREKLTSLRNKSARNIDHLPGM